MSRAIVFGDVLEAADQLSLDEQQDLVAILNRRLAQAGRLRVAADVEEARKEFAEGRSVPATPDEIVNEILK